MQRRSLLFAPALLAQKLQASITAWGRPWDVLDPADWLVAENELALRVARPQAANPRRPIQFALLQSKSLRRFTLAVDVRRSQPTGSLIVVYAHQKEGYFNYVHLSDDPPAKIEVHNGVFHCFGGDRVRISPITGPAAIKNDDFHHVQIRFDGSQGLVETRVNGGLYQALKGIDLSLTEGRLGLGSFFNTATFRNFQLTAD